MVARWFDRDRPKALSTALNGASIGGVIWAPLLGRANRSGWIPMGRNHRWRHYGICPRALGLSVSPVGSRNAAARFLNGLYSSLRKDLEETRDIKQFGEQALRVTLRMLGATEGCVLLQGDQAKEVSHKLVQGLSRRTAELLTGRTAALLFCHLSGALGIADGLLRSAETGGCVRLASRPAFQWIHRHDEGRRVPDRRVDGARDRTGSWNGALLAGSRKVEFAEILRTAYGAGRGQPIERRARSLDANKGPPSGTTKSRAC